jgi:hypothetical protein
MCNQSVVFDDVLLIPGYCNATAHNLASLGMRLAQGKLCVWTNPLREFISCLCLASLSRLWVQYQGHRATPLIKKKSGEFRTWALCQAWAWTHQSTWPWPVNRLGPCRHICAKAVQLVYIACSFIAKISAWNQSPDLRWSRTWWYQRTVTVQWAGGSYT